MNIRLVQPLQLPKEKLPSNPSRRNPLMALIELPYPAALHSSGFAIENYYVEAGRYTVSPAQSEGAGALPPANPGKSQTEHTQKAGVCQRLRNGHHG